MSAFLEDKKNNQPAAQTLKGADAAELIVGSAYESLSIVGFNTTEAERLGLKQGDEVRVAPEDTGEFVSNTLSALALSVYFPPARNYPTAGKLVALNREEVIIQVQGQKGIIHAHFPRLGFAIQPVKGKHKL